MKNAGLAPLDAIEVKQRDKDYKRAQARERARSENYYKSFTRGYVHIKDAIEDHEDAEAVS